MNYGGINPLMAPLPLQPDLYQKRTFMAPGEPPFVGRTDEIYQIMQLLAATNQDHGRVVLVRGKDLAEAVMGP